MDPMVHIIGLILNGFINMSYTKITRIYCRDIKKGFTFIELIIYVAILTIFASAIILLGWNVVYGRLKAQAQREVSQNLRLVSDRILYEVKNGSAVTVVNPTKISITNADVSRNPTVIDLSSGQVRIGSGVGAGCNANNPCAISSKNVVVDTLNFEDYTGIDQTTDTIRFQLVIKYKNNFNKTDLSYQSTVESTVTTEVITE